MGQAGAKWGWVGLGRAGEGGNKQSPRDLDLESLASGPPQRGRRIIGGQWQPPICIGVIARTIRYDFRSRSIADVFRELARTTRIRCTAISARQLLEDPDAVLAAAKQEAGLSFQCSAILFLTTFATPSQLVPMSMLHVLSLTPAPVSP